MRSIERGSLHYILLCCLNFKRGAKNQFVCVCACAERMNRSAERTFAATKTSTATVATFSGIFAIELRANAFYHCSISESHTIRLVINIHVNSQCDKCMLHEATVRPNSMMNRHTGIAHKPHRFHIKITERFHR